MYKPYDAHLPNDGIIEGEPNEVYHSDPAISNSKLSDFHRSAKYYQQKYITGEIQRKETDALSFGSALHEAILEPDLYSRTYVVQPEKFDRRTKAGKQAALEFEDANAGKLILQQEDGERIERMAAAVNEHPTARELLKGKREVTFRTQIAAQYGFRLQARADVHCLEGCLHTDDESYVADIKTIDTLTMSGREWDNAFKKYGYYRQAALYQMVINTVLNTHALPLIQRFLFIAVEKNPPYHVAVFEPCTGSISVGLDEVLQDLERLSACIKNAKWPGLPLEIMRTTLPKYMIEGKAQ